MSPKNCTDWPIKVAWSNEEWVVDGADVRVSLVVCDASQEVDRFLDGKRVPAISGDLKAKSFDMSDRKALPSNVGRAVRGIEKMALLTLAELMPNNCCQPR